MKPQFLTNLMQAKRTATLLLVNLAFVICGVTIIKSEATAQRVYFDIKKGSSGEGDVSVSAGALRTNNGSYQMRDGAERVALLAGHLEDFEAFAVAVGFNVDPGFIRLLFVDQRHEVVFHAE